MAPLPVTADLLAPMAPPVVAARPDVPVPVPAPVPVPSPIAAEPSPAGGPPRRIGKTRNPWGVWLLVILTVGFYGAYWYYKVNEEVRDFEPSVRVNPLGALCTLWFGWVLCLVPLIVSWVNTGSRIAQAQQAAGRPERCSGALGLVCLLFPGGSYVYYQSQLNKVWDSYGNPPAGTPRGHR